MKFLLTLYLLLISLHLVVPATKKKEKKIVSRHLLNFCRNHPALKSRKDIQLVSWMAEASSEGSLLMDSSAQSQAACWMLHVDQKGRSRSKYSFLQRYALATLYMATTHQNTTTWDWDMAVLPGKSHNWMHPRQHECSWYGIDCGARSRITNVDLGFLKLDGIVPRELFLLRYMKDLDLHGNDLQGVLPHKLLDGLKNLKYLRLHMNGFFGHVAKEIKGMTALKELHLFGNYIGGTIPPEIKHCKNLEIMDLYANQLEGTIPKELAQLKQLKYLDLHDNNLVGTMPKEICDRKLQVLVSDCLGRNPEVRCDCCTICCQGLPDLRCVDMKTKQELTTWTKVG